MAEEPVEAQTLCERAAFRAQRFRAEKSGGGCSVASCESKAAQSGGHTRHDFIFVLMREKRKKRRSKRWILATLGWKKKDSGDLRVGTA